jgi:hypothetical protein
MDIGDMKSMTGNNPLSHTVTARKNEIVILKLESFYNAREQGQTITVIFSNTRQPIHPRGMHSHGSNRWGYTIRRIYERINVSVREEFAKDFQTFFAPSHPRQPIMN